MTTTQDLLVIYRTTSTRYHAAVTSAVESGDTCTLVVLGDGADWEDSVPAAYYARQFFGVAKGTGIGQWQPVSITAEVASAISSAVSGGLTGYATSSDVAAAVAGLASTGYVGAAVASLATSASVTGAIVTAEAYTDAAISAIPADDDSGLCVVPGAGAGVTLTLGTARRPSTTRPTLVTVCGTAAMTSTLLGAQSATVTLYADSSSTPTTVVGVCGPMTLSGVAATTTHAWTAVYAVPAGHYYLIAATGGAAGGVSIAHINETAM